MKGKQEKQLQTTATDSIATGHVSSQLSKITAEWDWYKNTVYMQTPKPILVTGDTIINKNYYTNNLPQPQVIIMEGGKGKQEAITENKDSMWESRFARMEAVLTEKSKTKETKVLSMWQIIGIAGAGVVIAVAISKLKIHF
jgi:hypothetical protein